jgi:hypothetical protein
VPATIRDVRVISSDIICHPASDDFQGVAEAEIVVAMRGNSYTYRAMLSSDGSLWDARQLIDELMDADSAAAQAAAARHEVDLHGLLVRETVEILRHRPELRASIARSFWGESRSPSQRTASA